MTIGEVHLPVHITLKSYDEQTNIWQVALSDGTPAIANFLSFNYEDGREADPNDEQELLPETTIIVCSCCIRRV